MADEIVIDFAGTESDQPEWWGAYQRRCEANRRAHCAWCNAFVSDEQAHRSWRKGPTAWGDCDDGPFCEPGKGCNRKAAPDA